jgi:hypothetical protein
MADEKTPNLQLDQDEIDIMNWLVKRHFYDEWTLIVNNGLQYEVMSNYNDEMSMQVIRDILYSMVKLIDEKYPITTGTETVN